MPKYIIHRDGAYNFYTTVADGACYECALTRAQLENEIQVEQGHAGMIELPARLERAHATGCSSLTGETLEECVACNRAGPNESRLPVEEFIARFLTLPQPSRST